MKKTPKSHEIEIIFPGKNYSSQKNLASKDQDLPDINKNITIGYLKLIFTLPFIAMICWNHLDAQVTQEWVARYNGSLNTWDQARAIAVDDLGNVYVTGDAVATTGNGDMVTIKYNSDGIEQWTEIYDGTAGGGDIGFSIAVDGSGNVYVTGQSMEYFLPVDRGDDFVTIKYNSSGTQEWLQLYDGGSDVNPTRIVDDGGTALALDDSGNVYVTGWSENFNSQWYATDFITIKYSNDGVLQWSSRFNGPANNTDDVNALALDDSSNVYITGFSTVGVNTDAMDCVTIKYSTAGSLRWIQYYNGLADSYDKGIDIVADPMGNSYVTGYCTQLAGYQDYMTIKYSPSGVEKWVRNYNGTGNDQDAAFAIALDEANSIIITGSSTGPAFDNDFATVKYDNDGTENWVKRYDGPTNGSDSGYEITTDNSGNIYVAGSSKGIEWFDPSDYLTIKYDAAGNEQWIMRYNGPASADDQSSAIAVDLSGNVYVTGMSQSVDTDRDYATVKYSDVTEINENEDAKGYCHVYPNPTNGRIYVDVPDAIHSIEIINQSGEVIYQVFCDQVQLPAEIMLSGLLKGVYFVIVDTDSEIFRQKIVLM